MPLHGKTGNPIGALPMRRPSKRATTSTPWGQLRCPPRFHRTLLHAAPMALRCIFARNLTALGSQQFRRSRKSYSGSRHGRAALRRFLLVSNFLLGAWNGGGRR